ncbi:MAG TPA: ABC transporter permease [Candidatus Coprenecus avistercoris]|uniref:ABC transporter permease n=1 Tax=Candidatus Coprenecus avistercoris TaxID=2840730 RepID=A0A9D1E2I1_9BACT|nr:ABC transporter permease [Candidatus Coprenecus avistercoris]
MRRIRFNRHTIFSTVLNVTGLTLALSVFMILMVQVMYDWRYDRCYPGYENVYRLEYTAHEDMSAYSVNWSRPMITMMKDVLPQAEAIGTYVYDKGAAAAMREAGSDKSGVSLRFADCDYGLLKVFPFEFTEGDTALFRAPRMALISERGAAKLFGKESPVGKEVEFSSSTIVRYLPTRFTIAGVYRDFPENSSMDREILVNLGNTSLNNTGEWAYYCYVRTSDRDGLQSVLDTYAYGMSGGNEKAGFRLTPLHDAYYNHNTQPDNIAKGNRSTTITLFSVALLILIIAAINFVNFSMASVPFRIKGLNTRRVVGATRGSLIWSQLGATLALVLTAFVLSAGAMSIAATTGIASYISGSLRVQDNPAVLLIGLGAATVTALTAGIFPARYSTSFNPAMVLKGSFSLSARGRNLRSVLVGVQYLISFVLIICALFITLQVRYMKGFDMGYEREHIVEFSISNDYSFCRETLREMLLENPAVTDVTFSGYSIASETKMPWGRSYNDEPVEVECLPVESNFISFFGLELTGGRDFLPSDDLSPDGTMIVNQTFLDRYPFYRIGSRFTGHTDNSTIIGTIRDFNFKPLQHSIGPFCLYNFGSTPWWQLSTGYVKIIPGDIQATFDFIRKTLHEADPSISPEDIDIHFLDDTVGSLYAKEDRLGRVITTASWISLLISVIGILGLVYFETQFRRKEIAVRRVHGASVAEILTMINRYYMTITLICFILTAPVSFIIIRKWVSSFPYRSPVPVWIFIAALALTAAVTAVTVTLCSRRAALRNPVESISNE